MAETTGISWTDSTWNPWRGCLKVSEGCANCYAETLSKRNPKVLGTWGPEATGTRVVAADRAWNEPFTWDNKARTRRPWRVFCASLADVFEDWRGPMADVAGYTLYAAAEGHWTREPTSRPVTMADVRTQAFRVMESTLNLTWLVLTKRPQNILRMVPGSWREKWPAHVWIGTTTENQARADERIPELLKVPAAVRWLSVEPQIGPVDLGRWVFDRDAAIRRAVNGPMALNRDQADAVIAHPGIHWVITGGESGAGARPFRTAWARDLMHQCRAAGVACFHKQHGAHAIEDNATLAAGVPREMIRPGEYRLTLKDKAGADPAEWHPNMRVQQFPSGAAG